MRGKGEPSIDWGIDMATRLPSSGAAPGGDPSAGAGAGCDPSGLILVHRIFRWLYRELPLLVRDVAPGDLARAAIVGDYARLDFFALHLHHETEDTVLWDRLEQRDPACGIHVELMRTQHAEVSRQLGELEPQLEPWTATADPALGERFAAGIEGLRDTLLVHLGREEDTIMPVAAAVMSQREWDELETHTRAVLMARRKEFSRDILSLQLGLLLASVPDDEREAWFRANVPVPIRVLYLLLMKRRYDRAMVELYPGRPVPAMM